MALVERIPKECGGCGGALNAGTGKFVLSGGSVRVFHAGRCAFAAGAVPGSKAIWGEVSQLAAVLSAGADGMDVGDAAREAQFREGLG